MARPRENILEYRSYDLNETMPVEIHRGQTWKISPVRSSRLHIHNCFEIGICLSGRGSISFGREELPFREGDALFVGRNVPHTTWSSRDTGSEWRYIHADPELVLGEAVIARASAPQRFAWMFSECHMQYRSDPGRKPAGRERIRPGDAPGGSAGEVSGPGLFFPGTF